MPWPGHLWSGLFPREQGYVGIITTIDMSSLYAGSILLSYDNYEKMLNATCNPCTNRVTTVLTVYSNSQIALAIAKLTLLLHGHIYAYIYIYILVQVRVLITALIVLRGV